MRDDPRRVGGPLKPGKTGEAASRQAILLGIAEGRGGAMPIERRRKLSEARMAKRRFRRFSGSFSRGAAAR